MEKVHFSNNPSLFDKAAVAFDIHKNRIKQLLPDADIQHVGSTAIPNSLTKGDLDIQVRVSPEYFPKALQELSKLYQLNNGSIKTESFRAFMDDLSDPPLGVQLTVIESQFDFFWKFREVLLQNSTYKIEYDELKRNCEGMDMDEYREIKDAFFQKLMETPEYQKFSS